MVRKMAIYGKGVREKVRIAVASKSGIEVDQHFGKAEQFMIFDVSGDERKLIGLESKCC